MTIRAKLIVTKVSRVADHTGEVVAEEVMLNPVYGPDGSANGQWSKYTPAGRFEMTINNKQAFGKLLPGQFYFVDFTPTDKSS